MRPADFDRIVEHIEAVNGDAAGGCRKITGNRPHGRRLSSSVRTQKTQNLALFNVEGEIGNRVLAVVAFRQISNFDHLSNIFQSPFEHLWNANPAG